MHIFLTGEMRVGKSTVIQRAVSMLNLPVGGFCTGFDSSRGLPDRCVYLWDAAGEPAYDESHAVVRMSAHGPQPLTDRFDTLGPEALRRARRNGARLILMDECGRFEEHAKVFQAEIFAALDGPIPVLGVVRQGFHGWLDPLRSHPNVTVLTVTTDNREALPEQISGYLRRCLDHCPLGTGLRESVIPDR